MIAADLDLDELGGQDFLYRSLLRRLAFERDLARVIPFREETKEFFLIGDQQCADIFIGHHLDGFKNGGLGGNGPNGRTLLAEDFVNRADWVHC